MRLWKRWRRVNWMGQAHVAAGCEGRRHPDPFAPGSPERAALAAAVEEQLR